MHRMVRVEAGAYSRLAGVAGKLQARLGHKVSLSDAIDYLACKHDRRAGRFWRRIREKKASGLGGRGPKRRAAGKRVAKDAAVNQESPAEVHPTMNHHRREVS